MVKKVFSLHLRAPIPFGSGFFVQFNQSISNSWQTEFQLIFEGTGYTLHGVESVILQLFVLAATDH